MDRRQFLKVVGATSAVALIDPVNIFVREAMAAPKFFGLHPFIEAHPEAVFIKRTNVAQKTDAFAKRNEGLALAKEIFVNKDTPGIPLSHRIAVKPNLTCSSGGADIESGMGIVTDPDFVEGVIEGMKELGFAGEQFHLIELNCPGDWSMRGYPQMAARTGAHLRDLDQDVRQLKEGEDITWVDCPDGVIFKRIGYLAPVNQPDTWLLNIAKWKTHGMGLTLCCKNQQGMCANPYVRFCATVGDIKSYPEHVLKDFQPDFKEQLDRLYAKHVEAEIPRWDKPDPQGGYWMETWAQRTCDSLSVTDTGFCIIEGIYGRDGDGFHRGPGPNGQAMDYMTNILIFGKDKFRVDIIGHWLAGHEPGNFGFFHIAKERRLSDVLNPMDVPVYLWEKGAPVLTPLTDFTRTPLKTYYLQKNYGDNNEPWMHLVDEPYDYGPSSVGMRQRGIKSDVWGKRKAEIGRRKAEGGNRKDYDNAILEGKPKSYLLSQNYPNPFNPKTFIEYRIPKDGHVRIEVYNQNGQIVDVLVNSWQKQGIHLVSWNAERKASGTYFYRFKTDGFQEARKMVLIR
jgi:hypothetical protein